MDAEAGEQCLGVLSANLGLDVAFENRAGGPATRIAIVELEDRFEEGAVAR